MIFYIAVGIAGFILWRFASKLDDIHNAIVDLQVEFDKKFNGQPPDDYP